MLNQQMGSLTSNHPSFCSTVAT